MNKLVITHPGKAHFDEFLAISLVLAVHGNADFRIERRIPTKKELETPDIWVIDAGERYEPEQRNFDHHQSLTLPASFVLVASYLNLTPKLEVMPWWRYKDKVDCFGPFKMAESLGIESLRQTYSPVEEWLLKLFEDHPDQMKNQLQAFGQHIIEEADLLAEKFRFWEDCERIRIKDKTIILGLTDDSTGIQRYSERVDQPPDVSITYDGRGQGWKLTRLNDSGGVDFSKLEGHSDILFAHKTGFIAKTRKRIPLEKVLTFVELAIE